MQKIFHKVAVATLIVAGSAFATQTDLLSVATDGAISKVGADVVALNKQEMNEVVGGSLTWKLGDNQATGMTQLVYMIGETYNGNYYTLVGEIYGKSLTSGYAILALTGDPTGLAKVQTSHGMSYNYQNMIYTPTNGTAYTTLIGNNVAQMQSYLLARAAVNPNLH